MSAADMLAEILRLPVEERARLAFELIRSLDAEVETGATDAWDAEIARRGAEVDAGIAETMTVDEYRAHVRSVEPHARVDESSNPPARGCRDRSRGRLLPGTPIRSTLKAMSS